jgi:hypothetical protein
VPSEANESGKKHWDFFFVMGFLVIFIHLSVAASAASGLADANSHEALQVDPEVLYIWFQEDIV